MFPLVNQTVNPLLVVSASDGTSVWAPLAELAQSVGDRFPHIVVGMAVFAAMLLVGAVAKRAVRAVRRSGLDPALSNLLGGLTSAAVAVLGALVAAVVIFPGFRPVDLIAGLGITSIAVGFAFKDILQHTLSGVFILWRKPFRVGDQIRTRNREGTVEAINIRSTILKTYDGERVVVPNGDVYTDAVVVRTAYGNRRVRFVVGVGYPDSLEDARAVIHRVLAETEGVLKDPAPSAYVTELAPSSVNFTVFFWTEAEQAHVLRVSDRVATGIKLALDKAGIDIPYPHTVVHLNDAHGRRAEPDSDAGRRTGRRNRKEPARRGNRLTRAER